MAMLAVVVLCDGQRVYLQRQIVQRHCIEIFGTVIVSSLFSLFATAYLAAYVGLSPTIAKSMLPRSITVALALPMAEMLGGSASLTAALVCATGLIGAALGQVLMTMLKMRDEISRGVAQATSAHGLGTSALAANEPQALPFAAVTIAIMGTVSNLLLFIPAVRDALLAIIG
jgi:putative effector of murein hydrolase